MSRSLLKIGLLLVLSTALAFAITEPYSYSWHERGKSRWEELSPIFNFQSQRLGGSTSNSGSDSAYEQLVSIPAPPLASPAIVRHQKPYSYPYPFIPEFDNSDSSYESGHDSHRGNAGVRGEVDVSRERMGGFGGTGDVLGYGAYEYKVKDDSVYATPFTDIMRMPKSKSTFMDRFLNDHSLQNL